MNLTRLIYASTATQPLRAEDLLDILNSARTFNTANNISGMLCYGNGRFMQYFDGERSLVNKLYQKILDDKRHKDILLLDYAAIKERAYKNWSMGFIEADNRDIRNFLEDSLSMKEFRPEDMSETQALGFINYVKQDLYPQMIVKNKDTITIKDGRVQ